jgi:two-component system OmpR family sensor kinase
VSRLFTRIYLHFVGVLLVMALAAGVIGSLAFHGPILHSFAARLSTHAAGLVADRFTQPERVDHLVQRLGADLDMDITVRTPNGTLLSAFGNPLPILDARDLEEVEKAPIILSRLHPFCIAAPVKNDQTGAFLGVLEVSPRRRFGDVNLWRPILSLVGVLLLVGLATAPLARRLSRPVDQLLNATRRFGEGDLSHRIAMPMRHGHRRPDQLLELTRAWNEMAERIQTLIGGHRELLANVSHELRSPLARLRVALELLPKDPSTEARFSDIELDLSELERLIDDVLTASRLEASGLPLRRERTDAASLLGTLAERAVHDPALAGKAVRVEATGALPLVADAALLKRALWNLVENAGKYGEAPVTISATPRDGSMVFAVSDEGPGIPAEERARVLEPFFRGDKARTPSAAGTPSQGFGLGLTLARRIAEAHGGSLRVEAVHPDGRGCRVVLTVPADPTPSVA